MTQNWTSWNSGGISLVTSSLPRANLITCARIRLAASHAGITDVKSKTTN